MPMPVTIEKYDYRQPWDALYRQLMDDVWRCGYEDQSMYDISAPFLEWIHNPATDPAFCAKAGGRIVGFVSAMRRPISLHGRPRDAYLIAWFAVHPAFQRQGIGAGLLKAVSGELAKDPGRLAVLYLDRGHASTQVFKKFAARENLELKILTDLAFFAKILDFRAVDRLERFRGLDRLSVWGPVRRWLEWLPNTACPGGRVRPYQETDLAGCRDLLNEYSLRPDLVMARRWDEACLRRQLQHGEVAYTQVFEKDGRVAGLMNYYVITVRGNGALRVAVLENVHLARLSRREQRCLAAATVAEVRNQGCRGLIGCDFRYFDQAAFRWLRFVPYSRFIHFAALGRPEAVQALPALVPQTLYFDQK